MNVNAKSTYCRFLYAGKRQANRQVPAEMGLVLFLGVGNAFT